MAETRKTKIETIREAIRAHVRPAVGALSATPLPSERALMMRYGAARETIRRAIDDLVVEGLLVREPRKGVFFSPKARQQLGRIGLIMPVSHSDVFVPICQEVVRLAQENGYTFLLADVTAAPVQARAKEAVRVAENIVAERVSGVIFHPLQDIANSREVNESILDVFHKAKIPVVLSDCDTVAAPDASGYDVVGSDNVHAGWALAKYLESQGARRIAFMTHPTRGVSHYNRLFGFKTALSGDVLLCSPDDIQAVRRLVKGRTRPDAIICSNDRYAMNLYHTLTTLGLRVPYDIRVAGFDDTDLATAVTPQLTTMHQPCTDIARMAFRLLQERIANPLLPGRSILFKTRLIIRESTCVRGKEQNRVKP